MGFITKYLTRRAEMPTKTVRAVHLGGRRFEATEDVAVHRGAHIRLVIEEVEEGQAETAPLLPRHKVRVIVDELGREEIYGERL